MELPRRRGDPKALAWSSVAALVCAGMALCGTTAYAFASLGHTPRPVRTPQGDPAKIALGVAAYERGEWEEAEEAFQQVLETAPGHARAQDYLERLELIGRDADRLRLAEEALVGGDPRRAAMLASSVAQNSPLFAQSERVARSAHEQLGQKSAEKVPSRAEAAAPSLDVTVALGEALALYEAGNFTAAIERASKLALQAQPDMRTELLGWVENARRFAARYQALPREDANLVHRVPEALEAVSLDEQLSDGHYARELRERMTTVLLALGTGLLDKGDPAAGCVHVQSAAGFAVRSDQVDALARRCENEAFKRIAQARELERTKPDEARKLYQEALAIAAKGSASQRAAEAAMVDLEWSSPR